MRVCCAVHCVRCSRVARRVCCTSQRTCVACHALRVARRVLRVTRRVLRVARRVLRVATPCVACCNAVCCVLHIATVPCAVGQAIRPSLRCTSARRRPRSSCAHCPKSRAQTSVYAQSVLSARATASAAVARASSPRRVQSVLHSVQSQCVAPDGSLSRGHSY